MPFCRLLIFSSSKLPFSNMYLSITIIASNKSDPDNALPFFGSDLVPYCFATYFKGIEGV